jgi:ribosomal protein S18 acetylase RimI-like enzyme
MKEISTPLGRATVRPETSEDLEFRLALFAQSRPDLALLPEQVRAGIVEMQFRAQIASYHAQFPGARYDIVELDGRAAGRIVSDESDGLLHLVDIALPAALRNRGLGTAIMQALMDSAKASGGVMRLSVADGNPARRLYGRLGFGEVARHVAYTVMEWPIEPASRT